ncbi:hypothetical protein FD04_GL001105 [Secundilactobacillus odoratitofui DSM 19909 = JCM 15043]|uniref:DUF2929 domain-containing protein n=1 Tax=Secundilactobacillus odoratitofui DSM 19909 = JCM 15043 TaxID=1423776 RepID=A0A0R1LR06_9LACO|nr:YjzD family protein [Secundilactobacillus odoratitofui]KRK98127.1 hypothetical protein FD04_GL001105 [Secundilactobacillus odoratitofui DSM 19909 = JCM 15043]
MKKLEANLVVIFWAVIFGEVIGYIGGALELMTYNKLEIGVIAAVVALILVNGISLLSASDVKSHD